MWNLVYKEKSRRSKGGVGMLAAERQTEITRLIEARGSVQVEELARELKVSAMTIRRDLLKLEETGRI